MTADDTVAAASATRPGEPTIRVGGRWIAAFAVAWLGIWMAQLTPIQLLLPAQIENELGTDYWVSNVLWFGIVSGIAGCFAIVVYPLTGALSDRTVSRFGRRRPWIAAGAVIFAVALVLLGVQTTVIGVAVFWSLTLIGFCVLTAALTATISDQVPTGQRGYVSGWLSAPQAIGLVLGLVLVSALFPATELGKVLPGYLLVAILLVVLSVPFLLIKDPGSVAPARARAPLTLRSIASEVWISPRRYPDFAWTLASRVLVNFSNALGTGLLLYFLEFGLNEKGDAENDLTILSLIYVVFIVIASLAFGHLSDRLDRRKLFVLLAAVLQGMAAVLLAFWPSLPAAMIAGGLLGLGYGCFLSVDQALATQVLPDPETRGKDLGVMNLAWAVPQAFGPLLGGLLVFWLGGFGGLFVLAAVMALAGAACVVKVRSVR